MKNLMKASIVAIAMSATSVWAQNSSPEVSPLTLTPASVTRESLTIANMINSDAVQSCIADVADHYRAQISISDIKLTSTFGFKSYVLEVVALVGGDAAVGSANLFVSRTVGIPWGVHYDCRWGN